MCEIELASLVDIENVSDLMAIVREEQAACLESCSMNYMCKYNKQVSKTEGFQQLAQAFPQIMAELFAHVRSSHYLDPSEEKGTTYLESISSQAPKKLNAVPESAAPWSEAAQSQGAVKNSGAVEKKEDGGRMEKWMGDIQGNLSRDIGELFFLAACLHCLNTTLNTTHPFSIITCHGIKRKKMSQGLFLSAEIRINRIVKSFKTRCSGRNSSLFSFNLVKLTWQC